MRAQDRQPQGRDEAPADAARRRFLVGGVSAYVAARMPWAAAQEAPDEARGAFLAVSAFIAGRPSLDRELSDRLYAAHSIADGGFANKVRQLRHVIEQRRPDPLELQALLEGEFPPLAATAREITAGWFLGTVRIGDEVRAIAYEKALNAEIVGDVLMPPSYCYGVYGSWAEPPGG